LIFCIRCVDTFESIDVLVDNLDTMVKLFRIVYDVFSLGIRRRRRHAHYLTVYQSRVETLIKELQTVKNTTVFTVKKLVDETDHYQSLIDSYETQLKELNLSHVTTNSSLLTIKSQLNQRTSSWTEAKNKLTAKQVEFTKIKGELTQAKNEEHDHEAHAKILADLEEKSKKQLERLQALEAQGHLHLEEIKQKEIIERQQLEDISTDLNNRKGQVEEAKGILNIRSEELKKQEDVYNSHQNSYNQKQTDLRTTKTNLDKVTVIHTQKLTEYEQTNLRLKTIVTEKEQLKFQTTAQKQEHDELEKKALAYEDDLAVVTGAKRALAITYNETLTHVKEVHDKLVEVQTGITSKRNDLVTANTDHTKLFEELGELKAKYAKLNQSEHDHELHAAQLAEKVLKQGAELEALKAEEEKEKQEIESLKILLAELNEKITGSRSQLEFHEKEVTEKVGLHKTARDTHEVKHNKLEEIKAAHTKIKTVHLDAQSKHQQLQKKIAQLELKLAGLNKDDANTETKLQALAALEAEERTVIEKSLANISDFEAQVTAAKEELQSVYPKISEKEKEIIQHRETHTQVVTEYKTKIEEVSTKIVQHDSILGQLYSLVEHGKSILREAKKAISAKAKGGEHHHHVVVIEYSTSSSSD